MLPAIPRRNVILGTAALGLGSRVAPWRRRPCSRNRRPARLRNGSAPMPDGLRYADIDAATIEAVKSHFIDTIGCVIAAFDEKPVRICRDVAMAAGGGVSTIIGTDRRTTPDLATFANAAAARYLDLNDVYVGHQAAHPSDNIAACLAIAEARAGERHRARNRDRARLRDQLPADRSVRPLGPRLGRHRVQPAGRGARRRQIDEAQPGATHRGRQHCGQRPHPDGPDPHPDPVRLERSRRRRSVRAMRSSPRCWRGAASRVRRHFRRPFGLLPPVVRAGRCRRRRIRRTWCRRSGSICAA